MAILPHLVDRLLHGVARRHDERSVCIAGQDTRGGRRRKGRFPCLFAGQDRQNGGCRYALANSASPVARLKRETSLKPPHRQYRRLKNGDSGGRPAARVDSAKVRSSLHDRKADAITINWIREFDLIRPEKRRLIHVFCPTQNKTFLGLLNLSFSPREEFE
jgi:hypothetical protein